MICKYILLIIFLNEIKLFFCTHLNVFQHFYQTGIILFTLNLLFAQS